MNGTPVQLSGDLPATGATAPDFTLVGSDLSDLTSEQFAGRRVVLNIFPSVDTGVCASKDLPFAQARFCGAEGLDDVVMGSDFRGDFGEAYGLVQADGPLKGLLARAVIVLDRDGTVIHSQLVPEIKQEPDYDAAIAALG